MKGIKVDTQETKRYSCEYCGCPDELLCSFSLKQVARHVIEEHPEKILERLDALENPPDKRPGYEPPKLSHSYPFNALIHDAAVPLNDLSDAPPPVTASPLSSGEILIDFSGTFYTQLESDAPPPGAPRSDRVRGYGKF